MEYRDDEKKEHTHISSGKKSHISMRRNEKKILCTINFGAGILLIDFAVCLPFSEILLFVPIHTFEIARQTKNDIETTKKANKMNKVGMY